MSESYNFQTLKSEILERSSSSDWETARKEWALVNIFPSEEPETCLCGHYPIVEICTIKNRITGIHVDVGNVCVHRFLGPRSDKIFDALKRVQKDESKSFNEDAIVFFYNRGALNEWEYRFLYSTMKKRKMTPKQLDARLKINRKLIEAVQRRGFQGN